MIRLICILLLIFLGNAFQVCHGALPAVSKVLHIGYVAGLSSQRVYSIVEDKNHAIWISTKSGVDRYNGQTLKNYALSDGLQYGDMAARIIQLSYTPDGILWAYDNKGRIYRYSEVYDEFELILQLSQHVSGSITLNKCCMTRDGKIFFGLTSGLYVLGNNKKIRKYVSGLNVNDIVSLNNKLYLGTTSGLKIVNLSRRKTVSLMNGINIQTLYYDGSRHNLFIGTFNRGLWIYHMDHGEMEYVNAMTDFYNNPIRSIVKYDSNTLLVGIDGSGIFTYDYVHKRMERLIDSEDNANDINLMSNGVYAIFKDSSNGLWAGSYTGGVSRIIFSRYPINFIIHKKNDIQSLINNNVKAIAEDGDGNLWFATERGISIYRKGSNAWSHILPDKVCVSLCRGNGGEMLVGTYGKGIFVLGKGGNIVRHLTKHTDQLTSNYIFTIKRDADGDYWVGSIDGNLMYLDSKWNLKKTYDIKQVFSLERVGKDIIAAATADGFYLINKRTGKVGQFAKAREMTEDVSTYMIPMLFNPNRTVWLGTEGGGLLLYDYAKRRIIRHLTMRDGLPSNDIYGILTDPEGRLWISTGAGIAIMHKGKIWNLNYINNINQEYNKAACFRTHSGILLFGGIDGVVEVNPSEMTRVNYNAPLRLTRLDVDIPDNRDSSFIRRIFDMLMNRKVTLKYNQNSFSIDFESINLRYQNDIIYKFILEGYDNAWSEASSTETARYKNVASGDYIFKVCSISKSTGKIIDEKSIEITVLPPWWNTWWAWLGYLVIFGLVCYFAIRYKLYQLQKKHDDDKINFFINTSHDIQTPITLVMGPLEDMRKEGDLSANAKYLLGLADANIKKLYSLTSQLLEFEKIGTNLHKEKMVSINLCEMLTEEVACFQAACDKKGLKLLMSLPEEEVCVKATQRMLEIIFDNLISNACKYTEKGGAVKVALTADAKKVTVRIADTGIGIPQDEHKYIFSDIHRARNAYESQVHGMGFGLLQVQRIVRFLHGRITFSSKEGVGTTFTVTLNRVFAKAVPSSRQSSIKNILNEVLPVESSTETEYGSQGETILVVEDNDDLRHYLCKTLSPNYKVIGMPNADEALSYMRTEYPDLIISDVMMPGMQGDDFCRIVKEKPETAGIPIILLTAKTDHEAVVTGLRKGADDYLTKPFSTEILRIKIKGMIENRKRMREYLLRHAVNKVENKHDTDVSEQAADEPDGVTLSENDRMFVEKATEIVSQNMGNTDFSIDMLCREMGMSRTLFYNRLKSLTGRAPQEFIRIIRLEHAAELLKHGMSVIEASEATGFVNVKYFSTVFKKHFGTQPSKFSE